MMIGIDVFHDKLRFNDQQNLYFQKAIIKPNGEYLTSCDIKETKSRNEFICKADSDSDASSVKSSELPKEERAAEFKPSAPTISQDNFLEQFITRSIKEHNVNPDIIIVHRDGVGDSMLDVVKETEVRQAKTASKNAKLIFAVAQKRIHIRFMIDNKGIIGNPPPGTLIQDASLADSNYKDYFLIPTKSSLSTVKPVRYIILQNDAEEFLPMDQFQNLTFAMCFCYPNWTDSIKLPMPTQLAHKLAYLMGETNLPRPEINPNLLKTFFYL